MEMVIFWVTGWIVIGILIAAIGVGMAGIKPKTQVRDRAIGIREEIVRDVWNDSFFFAMAGCSILWPLTLGAVVAFIPAHLLYRLASKLS